MLDQYVFDFDNGASGRILKFPAFYMATLGWDWCDVGQITAGTPVEWGAFFRFDTSSLPDHCEITLVQFRVRRDPTVPFGDPQFYQIRFSIGQFIGGVLNGNAGEWNGGTEVLTLSAPPFDKTTVDFDAAAKALVSKTGDTDVKILDHSTQGTGDSSWSKNYNADAANLCKLYVYFTVPSATVTAKGTASCSATVIHAATATATGVGGAEMAAHLVLASAAATVTGRGSADLEATVTHNAAATATGVGTSAAAASLILLGSAEVTGTGSAVLAAHLELHAAGTATGIGTATCQGKIDVYFPPLAVDEDTISVVAVDSASIAVASAHTATISAAGDTATVGRRRN